MDFSELRWIIVNVGQLEWAEVGLWWILLGESECQCVEADHNGLGQVLVWWLHGL